MKNKKSVSALRDIEYYFRFLFERGFRIHEVKELSRGDWQVTLALDDCGIVIYNDQDEIGVVFSPIDSNLGYRVGLESMIYFLTNGQIFIGKSKKSLFNANKKNFERLSSLTDKYVDQIIPYFGKDYDKYKQELMLTQQKYLNIYLDKYVSKRKHRDWE